MKLKYQSIHDDPAYQSALKFALKQITAAVNLGHGVTLLQYSGRVSKRFIDATVKDLEWFGYRVPGYARDKISVTWGPQGAKLAEYAYLQNALANLESAEGSDK